ncbi:class I SAM-dependent methyltransferase [Aquabacterium sp. J223]|uniref:class I SAM-dependent methyltransferase n=1 Tax=Aquabacterium sp. J223 TaxID=2898431 RepID=UPI0021ADD838|nr:methyltransferase domain-containing protein [Aquabacterium sp. J223]UUX95060.1 methyltransferase domain-containing protein [Aquabacterium sp. J223]
MNEGGLQAEIATSDRAVHGAPANRRSHPAPRPVAQGVARTYDRLAPLYDWVYGASLEPGRRAMAEAAAALQPGSLLEVGVGTGLALEHYPATTRVLGVDVSHDMLERARQRAAKLPGRDIGLQLMNAEAMDLPDAAFDCVTVPYVLSVTPHPERLVQEVRRVCKPGGHILIVNHFSGSRFWWLMERAVKRLADRVGFRSEFRYEDHIAVHDWQVLSSRPVNLFDLSKLVVIRNGPSA